MATLEAFIEIDKKVYNDGCGDISFKLIGNKRVPFFAGWPSVRPWYFNNPEPTFRCISDAEIVALKLSEAARSRISEINDSRLDDEAMYRFAVREAMRRSIENEHEVVEANVIERPPKLCILSHYGYKIRN